MNSAELANKAGAAIDLGAEADFSLGDLVARPASREIVVAGKVEMIEPRVMQALVALARRRGEVVSRDQLVDACWSSRVVSEDAITRCIAKVRRLASATTFELETIPRVGYRLVAGLAPSANREGLAATTVPVAITLPKFASRRKNWVLITGAIVVLCVAGGSYWTWRVVQALGASTLSEAGALLDSGAKPNFAVLPFDALSRDADADYLADAIPAAINNQLIGLGFQVVSPAVAFQYRGERKAQAATELGPRYIIDGSVRLDGDKLHVTARVDWASQPVSVWSQDFAVSIGDASNLPGAIATTLASLSIFRTTARTEVSSSPTVTAGGMRVAERMRTGDDMGAYLLAKDLLRETPNALLTQTYYMLATAAALDLLPRDERVNALADARKVASQAATFSPYGAPVSVQALMPVVEWSARERILQDALDVDAPLPALRYTLASQLASTGRIAEAKSIARAAAITDPLSSTNVLVYAASLDIAGQREEAATLLARAERLWPNLEAVELLRFATAVAHGDSKTASAMMNNPTVSAILDPPAERQPYAAIVRALTTREAASIASVERACADPSKLARRRSGPCLSALVVLGRIDTFFKVAPLYFPEQRGDSAQARDARWLESPLAWRNLRMLFRTDMAALRTDARFIPLVERMGLLEYWRSSGKWPDFCDQEPASVCGLMRVMRDTDKSR